jgi:hypothetical protein
MVKQSQVRPVGPVRPFASVKTGAAVLIAGAALTLPACSSGASSNSASKAAAPHTSATAASASMHPGSHMTSPGTHMTSPGAHMTSPGTHAASPATTQTASTSACKHVASLRTSLQDLSHRTLNASSSSKLKTDLTNIQTQVAAIKSHGGGAFSSQLNQLNTAVDNLKSAAHGMSTPPTKAQVTAISTALFQLKTLSKSAIATMNAACPK